MYKVSIVEDQTFIANAIASTIRKHLKDFEVCGVYQNGQDCLSHIEENIPDIILTDINMPIMDGLMLSEQLVSRFPEIKIIILTGYDDFNYARSAIRLGICNYLLKPCSCDDLSEALGKVAEKIDIERKQQETIHSYYEHFITNLPSLRQQTIISLLYHYHTCTREELVGLQSEHLLQECSLFLIDPDFIHDPKTTEADRELLLFCSMNILEELLETIDYKELFLCGDEILLIFPTSAAPAEEIKDLLYSSVSRLESVLNGSVRLCEGGNMEDILSCRKAYLAALDKRSISSESQMDDVSDTAPSCELLETAITYIALHYHEDLSLSDLADRLFISYNYLSSLFTQTMGINFSVYLTKIRIEKACELLKQPSMKVVDIAELTGYQNYRYFNHVFKKMTGYTPTEYRRINYIDRS